VDETYRQLRQITERERLGGGSGDAGETETKSLAPDALERCLLAGFVDQLAQRRDSGSLDCDLTEGRRGTLARETVVTESKLLVYANIREISGRAGALTLLTHATAVKPEWLGELFPQHLRSTLECVYDRTHKRVAAVRIQRFFDLVIGHEHQREVDPVASATCLADAYFRGWMELPNVDHAVRQFVARSACVRRALPELEFPIWNEPALCRALIRAFHGLTLAKEAQGVALLTAFQAEFGRDRVSWLEEMAPLSVGWEDRKLKLNYAAAAGSSTLVEDDGPKAEAILPEAQLKLTECLPSRTHPVIAEGKVPVRLWLQLPDGKRLDSTTNWPHWREQVYPKHRSMLKAKYPGFLWP
jgi:ATP-dependent helicase HrpB